MDTSEIENLKEALKHSPDNIPLRFLLGNSYVKFLLWQEAEKEFKHILKLDPSNETAKLLLAKSYFHQNKLSEASVVAEELISYNNKEAYVLQIKILIKENNLATAIEQYKEVLNKWPDFSEVEIDSVLRQSAAVPTNEDNDPEENSKNILEKPSINFKDVGGLTKIKDEIELKIIHPLKHPEIYKAYGKNIGGGILLYGPPGCGKTFIAKATAGQIDSKFINVGINDILDMWIGNSEKNLHSLFDIARKNKPCVLFFDEVDALGASRSDMKQSSGRHLINQFLSELDGVGSNNEGILIMAATNAPWHLDSAFRRPGRFDRIIFVEPPDAEGREEILKILLQGKPVEDIDYRQIAKNTPEYSGADLKALIDIAIEEKLTDSIKSGKLSTIKTKDLINASKKHKPSTKEWFNSARNYALYANDSGLYDGILDYLKIKK